MSEEIKTEQETEQPKKKRGRPKKEKVIVVEQKVEPEKIEPVEEIELPIIQAETEQTDIKEPEKKPEEVRVASLNDKLPFPEERELTDDEKSHLENMNQIKTENKEVKWWKKLFSAKKIKKPNTVAILLLYPKRAVGLYREYDSDGMFSVEDLKKNPLAKTYHVREDCMYTLENGKDRIPLCILPVWSMIPLGTQAWFELSQERRGLELQEAIKKNIRAEETVKQDENLKKKSKMSPKTVWIIIAVIIIGYFVWKSMG